LYKAIEKHPNPREIYNQKLLDQGSVDASLANEMEKKFRALLQDRLNEAKEDQSYSAVHQIFGGSWSGLALAKPGDIYNPVKTAVPAKHILSIAKEISTLPADKKFFKKIEKLFEERRKMSETKIFDWAMGELMAYGTLLRDGFRVRVSGQDVERGTFSHRHAVITLEDSAEEFIPLATLDNGAAKFEIYNSHLSEYGVLGFEYGYALANPMALTIWEAQFGDFVNGAQIVIDQFITSAETKWQRSNGLVMLLPHGFEGQGPEHSSARIERFLEACADENIQVVNCTTPANFFHVLRRQLKRNFRKPLVVFTPKSLLRSPKCVSKLEEFSDGGFSELIDDAQVKATDVKRVLFCSGKIYYDLLEKQQTDKIKDIAIVRLEQLYPLPYDQIEAIRVKYKNAVEHVWVQEEPENMGPWPYISRKFRKSSIDFDLVSRNESSSTATGYAKLHAVQQLHIIAKAFEVKSAGAEVKKKANKTAKYL
jgi:2-oxoglutarate dehydrogenase E1 component